MPKMKGKGELMRHKGFWIVALVLALALALMPARHIAWAAIVIVDSTTDNSDGDTSSIANLIANPGGDGVISLREAIVAANNTPGSDTIDFDIPGCGGGCAIQPTNALPPLSGGGTTIDGYSQPGAAPATDGTPAILLVEINGASAGDSSSGFRLTSAGNTIKGLVINRFPLDGIHISGSSATSNTVLGNYIGIDTGGGADLGNAFYGVYIGNGAKNNTVGGDTAGERNIISGNDISGVYIGDNGTTDNLVSGNYIGINASGTAGLGNTYYGVYIGNGAQDNIIGGNTISERNIISGNNHYGVCIAGNGTTANKVLGNIIGTNTGSLTGLGNGWDGVYVGNGAQKNVIGGDIASERNIISGNGMSGVSVADSGTMTNTVSANYIGINADGVADLGNSLYGVYIGNGAKDNIVGGDAVGEGNVISGNDRSGLLIYDSDTTGNVVSGNYIGTDISGTQVISNINHGIIIGGGASNNVIGGDAVGERNIISGNGMSGVYIADSGTMSNVVSGNYIGTDANGTAGLGNGWNPEFRAGGVRIVRNAQNNIIGGDSDAERNVISGNNPDGVFIGNGDMTTNNIVSGNYIGTDATGSQALANVQNGVHLMGGAQNNYIGPDNLISGNKSAGVFITGTTTTSNTVSGNYIGTDISGTQVISNINHGAYIGGGASNNVIGGDTAGERNIISGNGMSGVYIADNGTMSNVVSGNYIGTDANGTAGLGNSWHGVYIYNGAQNNAVGPGNVVAHNALDGVEVDGSSTTGNIITQNSIFSNTQGIDLMGDANGGIAAPLIVTTTVGSVSIIGTACADCAVEVFENGDTDGEGETFVGDSTADSSGAFTVTVSSLSDLYLTATATDAVSGTSEFSAVFTATVTGGVNIYLPIVSKNY
jgi:hypothetical protein